MCKENGEKEAYYRDMTYYVWIAMKYIFYFLSFSLIVIDDRRKLKESDFEEIKS